MGRVSNLDGVRCFKDQREAYWFVLPPSSVSPPIDGTLRSDFDDGLHSFFSKIHPLKGIEIVLYQCPPPPGLWLAGLLLGNHPELEELVLPGWWCGPGPRLHPFVGRHQNLRCLRLHLEPGHPDLAPWEQPLSLPNLVEFEGLPWLLLKLDPLPEGLTHVRLLDATGAQPLRPTRAHTTQSALDAVRRLIDGRPGLLHLEIWSGAAQHDQWLSKLLSPGTLAGLRFLKLTQQWWAADKLLKKLSEVLGAVRLEHLVLDSVMQVELTTHCLGRSQSEAESAIQCAARACPTLGQVELS
ncbi:hypothetical protein C8R43DRAFT_1118506 [Mycena crocata]|nr:hypothetical protein C8R43DRAFT_1118506 [Mycena crocata]